MLKELTWGFFEKTGNIETFLEYCRLTDTQKGEKDDDKIQGSDN